MPKAKIIGATCKALDEATLAGETEVVVTTNAVLVSAINVTVPINIAGTEQTDTIVFTDSDDNEKFSLVTHDDGTGFVSFPAPILCNGIKVTNTATVVGKFVVYVID